MMQRNPSDNLSGYRNDSLLSLSGTKRGRKPSKVKEKPKAEMETVAAERLEAAGRLAGWIAHQINNPLGAISGNAQLLARRLQRDIGDPETLRVYLGYLEAIQSHTERCARITGEALNFTRPGDPELRKVDLPEAVMEAADLVRYAYPNSRIMLALDNEPGISEVKADREWLTRIAFEILSNAAVVSEDRPISVNICAGLSDVRVRISDSGPGIAEDVLPRIFDPFFSTRDEARGMGLTVSLEMTRKMGGSLKVERKKEGGCTFTAAFPIWGQRASGCTDSGSG
jgi:two-component system, NtrC family, sensor kinase